MRLLLLLLLAVAAQADDAPFAEIVDLKDGVSVNSKPAAKGPLNPGDLVEVEAGKSCLLRFADGSTATLTGHEGEGASLTLPPEAEGAAAQVLKIAKGAIAINVPPEKKSKWQVEAENCTASVEGTVFAVGIDPRDKTTRVLVSEGKVKVASRKGDVVVESGKETTVAPGQAPTPPDNYDPRGGLGALVEDQQGIKSGRNLDRK